MSDAAPAPATPEFSRPVLLAQLGDRPLRMEPSAEAEERAALMRRFGLASLDALSGAVELTRDGSVVRLSGRVKAKAAQPCVITGAPVGQTIDEPVELRFVREDRHQADDAEEIELSEDECDTLAHDGRAVDVGEALAQTLGLALDPFPRAPGADEAAREAGIKREEEAGAFGALAALKERMEKPGEGDGQ